MMQSLKQVVLTQEYVKSLEIEPRFHGRHSRDSVNFCHFCDREIFAIFFIKASDEGHRIHCLNCAHRKSTDLKGFICLEEYKLKELSDVYDAFKLHQQQPSQTSVTPVPQGSQGR